MKKDLSEQLVEKVEGVLNPFAELCARNHFNLSLDENNNVTIENNDGDRLTIEWLFGKPDTPTEFINGKAEVLVPITFQMYADEHTNKEFIKEVSDLLAIAVGNNIRQ